MLNIILLLGFVFSGIDVCAHVACPVMSLTFHNQTSDSIRLSVEERCLPSYQLMQQARTIASGERLSLNYDFSATHCVVLVPDTPSLGGKSHLFMLEPLKSTSPLDTVPSACEVKIREPLDKSRQYVLQSSCMSVTATAP